MPLMRHAFGVNFDEKSRPELLKLVQIIWINIILSGDNAVVSAMA